MITETQFKQQLAKRKCACGKHNSDKQTLVGRLEQAEMLGQCVTRGKFRCDRCGQVHGAGVFMSAEVIKCD